MYDANEHIRLGNEVRKALKDMERAWKQGRGLMTVEYKRAAENYYAAYRKYMEYSRETHEANQIG